MSDVQITEQTRLNAAVIFATSDKSSALEMHFAQVTKRSGPSIGRDAHKSTSNARSVLVHIAARDDATVDFR